MLEILDFLDESECNYIIILVEKVGFWGSDFYFDEKLEKSKEVVWGNLDIVYLLLSFKMF